MFHGDLPYSSKDIIKKLETLNEEHIIGCGGFGTVYKLAMDDGNVFALKRIIKMNEGFDRFFERELEILGSIKHRYLVNLRGYCNSPTSKLLIYDFLPGGSLDEALHGEILLLLLILFTSWTCYMQKWLIDMIHCLIKHKGYAVSQSLHALCSLDHLLHFPNIHHFNLYASLMPNFAL